MSCSVQVRALAAYFDDQLRPDYRVVAVVRRAAALTEVVERHLAELGQVECAVKVEDLETDACA